MPASHQHVTERAEPPAGAPDAGLTAEAVRALYGDGWMAGRTVGYAEGYAACLAARACPLTVIEGGKTGLRGSMASAAITIAAISLASSSSAG